MKSIFVAFSAIGALLVAPLCANAQFSLIQEWDFTTAAAGLDPTQVPGTVAGGLEFVVGGDGQLTTGNTLRLSPTAALNSHVELTDLPNLSSYHTLRAEFDIAGWDWSVGGNAGTARRLSLGFAGSVPTVDNFLFAAGGSIRLNTSGEISYTAESGGNVDTFDSSPTTNPQPVLHVHDDPLFLRIDWDVTNAEYSVYFSETAGVFTSPVFSVSGRVGTPREPHRFRLGPLDGIPWGGDYIDVDAVRLLGIIPEPSSAALLSMAFMGLLGMARRARS